MIDHLAHHLPRRWLVPAWIGVAAAAVGLLIGIERLLRSFGQDPLVWLGWTLIALGGCNLITVTADHIRRHVVAARTSKATVPDWLAEDWDELCKRAGLGPTPGIDHYAGINGMTTITLDDDLREQMLIRPALVDHPRPLVRYTLAVQAACIAANLTTAPATVLHMIGHALAWSSWMGVGIAAVAGAPWLLVAMIVGFLLAGGLVEIADTIGHRVYIAADYIAQTYLNEQLTTTTASVAEASPSWRYARFEPALHDRVSLDDTTTTGMLDQASQRPQLTAATDSTVPAWTLLQGGER